MRWSTLTLFVVASMLNMAWAADPPNVILVMADDMGWGQTGYYGHPVLKTPNLDEMASHGLRFDRFYAGAPNCSPTRATVLTGRTNDRTGVLNHGYPLRLQERTVADVLRQEGYATGHFGKWHLNGLRGPGAPIFKDDPRHPGEFGFETWLSVTNFFDRDPIMSRNGTFEEFRGDSSEIIVDEALKFVAEQTQADRPFLAVIWYGSPHSPFLASEEDIAQFSDLDKNSQHHYGELVAMDRSLGTLRAGLRELDIAENTFVCFCSDNGGLPKIDPPTTGSLRGFKNSMYEGGLRVPCVIEWPAGIKEARVTEFPACTMDLFPTILEVTGLDQDRMISTNDGVSLKPLFQKEINVRRPPILFRHTNRAAVVDNDFKLVTQDIESGEYELYNIKEDPRETTNLLESEPYVAEDLIDLLRWENESIGYSQIGSDYPEAEITRPNPEPQTWTSLPQYQEFLKQHGDRWEYRRYRKR